jgi:hypothetical protein
MSVVCGTVASPLERAPVLALGGNQCRIRALKIQAKEDEKREIALLFASSIYTHSFYQVPCPSSHARSPSHRGKPTSAWSPGKKLPPT